ncbi:MAG: PAS domain-containing protein [Chloroflexaceae bacterium]|nr:PAS domain-containing protein [Chloroflexaceae bacterium]
MSKPTIICIDDEILVLTSLRDSLTQLFGTDYAVEIAESGEEALEVISELAEENAEIPLIISDQIMPGMKGDQLLAQIHHQYPKTLKILLTGQASADDIGKALNHANLYRYIAKPWDTTTLNSIVCEGLRAYFNDKRLLESHDFLTALNQELEYQVSQRTQQLQQEIETRRQAEVQLQQRSDYIARFSDNLRQLHRLSTSHYDGLEALLNDYLATGCQILDYTTGIVARLEGDRLIVTAVHSDLSVITPGQIFPLSDSLCQSVVEQQRTIANLCPIASPKDLRAIAFNPSFQAYLGTPIWVNGNIYGTLSFSANQAKSQVDEQAREFMELMALSIGRIVENQLAQQQLQASETALNEAQKLAHLGNWNYDLLTGEISWSEETFRIYGRDRHQKTPSYQELLARVYPDDRAALAALVKRAIEQGLPYCVEYRWQHPDGQLRYLESRGKVVRNPAGQVVRLFGTVLDITAHKQAEAAMEAAKQAAEAANRAKSTFIANMSHELRTPLHAIMGFAQLLAGDRNLSQGQQEQLATIRSSSEHLLNLIDELLDFSKIEAKRVARHDSDFDLYQLLEELRQLLRLKAVQKGLQLQVIYGSELPRWVRSDRLKLRQILLNLLGNAIKFTLKGSVVLTAISLPEFPLVTGQSRLVFSVADTGIGMAAEELEQIFEPFVQANSSNFSTEGGAGLGLAISREYAQLLGGELAVTSQKKPGNCLSAFPRPAAGGGDG